MYLTVKQQLKHLSKEEYLSLRELSHTAKNLYNQAVYWRYHSKNATCVVLKLPVRCSNCANKIYSIVS